MFNYGFRGMRAGQRTDIHGHLLPLFLVVNKEDCFEAFETMVPIQIQEDFNAGKVSECLLSDVMDKLNDLEEIAINYWKKKNWVDCFKAIINYRSSIWNKMKEILNETGCERS